MPRAPTIARRRGDAEARMMGGAVRSAGITSLIVMRSLWRCRTTRSPAFVRVVRQIGRGESIRISRGGERDVVQFRAHRTRVRRELIRPQVGPHAAFSPKCVRLVREARWA